MQLLLTSFIILFGQGSLESYHLQIDPQYLYMLYYDPYSDLQFPAYVETPAGACSCLAGFRGGSSLFCPKKSWKLELQDTTLMDCSHILLDAQYRDKTIMRNALGLLMSREMGLPAPLTEHVEFYINGEYYGVYVQVERIDHFFYERNGLGDGPLFKSTDHLGRLVWQPSDTSGTAGFEAERGWDEALPLLRHLIDLLNLGFPHGISVNDVISNAAISIAIRDEDGISKNFYLHMTPEGDWRFYPWDRDATFGNRWDGEYQPEWLTQTTMFCFDISPLLNRMLRDGSNRQLYHDRMMEAAGLMSSELPGVIDSIYQEIRESVYADSMKLGTNSDFDEAVALLTQAVQERAEFLPQLADLPSPIEVVSMDIPVWNFQSGGAYDSVSVCVEFQSPPGWAGIYIWSDGNERVHYCLTSKDPDHLIWNGRFEFPPWLSNLRFAVDYHISCPQGPVTYYYPEYGYATSMIHNVCVPSARRSRFQIHHQDLQALAPVRYNTFLWSIPLVNASDTPLDLSYYGFQAGDPPARLFTPSSVVVEPWDTLYLTNNDKLLEMLLPWNSMVFGDLVLDSPAGTELLVLDPSWGEAAHMTLGQEVQSGESGVKIMLSEICHRGEGGDWIELFNAGDMIADISGWLVMDRGMHGCLIPGRTFIDPGRFLVICESEAAFRSFYGEQIPVVEALGFGLNGQSDGVCLMEGDQLVFSVMYDSSTWPLSGDLLYLKEPGLPFDIPVSWESGELPGTPGAPNPGWPSAYFFRPRIEALWPNPSSSSVSVQYHITSTPGEISVYDMAGRLVMEPGTLGSLEGTAVLELPPSLATGVYFAVVRASGASTSEKFVVLR
ncbi:MAG: CotH kinase family protein [Candidatus Fermentibacteraceae bacterium]|nr:CotH kinase family protein [Candidatus Fermentibacteraceae bacterium]MBN2609322.1 CotH kinase family protein [Candidatus Fermentibacteraceae bacterium]